MRIKDAGEIKRNDQLWYDSQYLGTSKFSPCEISQCESTHSDKRLRVFLLVSYIKHTQSNNEMNALSSTSFCLNAEIRGPDYEGIFPLLQYQGPA